MDEHTTIRLALENKGVPLGNPAAEAEIFRFNTRISHHIDPFFKRMYREFNGFSCYDQHNYIYLWPLSRINKHFNPRIELNGNIYFMAGDLLMDSDTIMFCFSNASVPIFLLHEQRVLAPTAREFYMKLADGGFDL